MLYRDYDQAGLDAQYNLRQRVPDFQRYFDDWKARSQAAREKLDCALDVAYGGLKGERLDIFPAAAGGTRGSAPIHVFIHGGYWQSLDKSDFDFIAEGFVNKGIAAVIVNYDLAPDVSMDEIVRQNRAAIAWVHEHAAEFGGDPDRITPSGHSAGGHLTAMMAATDWLAFKAGLPVDLVKAGLAISGLFDLEPIQKCYLNNVVGMDADEARRNSPCRYGAPTAAMILAVGGLETDEFLRQQADYAAYLRQRGGDAKEMVLDGFHHFSVIGELADPESPLNMAIVEKIFG